ncbi:MAG TPA: CopG family transcriptional regulator [Candidatus Binatia bacterium]|jgi:hypothetical protein
MKRTTIYLEPDLEMLLKIEMVRRKKSMAELVHDALRAYLGLAPGMPPGAGAFKSGRRDAAEKAEKLLARTRFGEH